MDTRMPDSSTIENVAIVCQYCERPLGESVGRCSRCQSAFYCSRECQTRDWESGNHNLAVCDQEIADCKQVDELQQKQAEESIESYVDSASESGDSAPPEYELDDEIPLASRLESSSKQNESRNVEPREYPQVQQDNNVPANSETVMSSGNVDESIRKMTSDEDAVHYDVGQATAFHSTGEETHDHHINVDSDHHSDAHSVADDSRDYTRAKDDHMQDNSSLAMNRTDSSSNLDTMANEDVRVVIALDLDHTILHCTMEEPPNDLITQAQHDEAPLRDADIDPRLKQLLQNESEEDLYYGHGEKIHMGFHKLDLGEDSFHKHGRRFLWIKFRPFVNEFLRFISANENGLLPMVYTHGRQLYAESILEIIDPYGSIFEGRVIARPEDDKGGLSGNDTADAASRNKAKGVKEVKELLTRGRHTINFRSIPLEKRTIVIDDRVDAWDEWSAENIIQVKPYEYFPDGIRAFPQIPFLDDLQKRVDGGGSLSGRSSGGKSASKRNAAYPPNTDKTSTDVNARKGPQPPRDLQLLDLILIMKDVNMHYQKQHKLHAQYLSSNKELAENSTTNDDPENGNETDDLEDGELVAVPRSNTIDQLEKEKFLHDVSVEADIRESVATVRSGILKGTTILFSSIVPIDFPNGPEAFPLWKEAVRAGAQCVKVPSDKVTHVVTVRADTTKVIDMKLKKPDVHVVHYNWVLDSIASWRMAKEEWYTIFDDHLKLVISSVTDADGKQGSTKRRKISNENVIVAQTNATQLESAPPTTDVSLLGGLPMEKFNALKTVVLDAIEDQKNGSGNKMTVLRTQIGPEALAALISSIMKQAAVPPATLAASPSQPAFVAPSQATLAASSSQPAFVAPSQATLAASSSQPAFVAPSQATLAAPSQQVTHTSLAAAPSQTQLPAAQQQQPVVALGDASLPSDPRLKFKQSEPVHVVDDTTLLKQQLSSIGLSVTDSQLNALMVLKQQLNLKDLTVETLTTLMAHLKQQAMGAMTITQQQQQSSSNQSQVVLPGASNEPSNIHNQHSSFVHSIPSGGNQITQNSNSYGGWSSITKGTNSNTAANSVTPAYRWNNNNTVAQTARPPAARKRKGIPKTFNSENPKQVGLGQLIHNNSGQGTRTTNITGPHRAPRGPRGPRGKPNRTTKGPKNQLGARHNGPKASIQYNNTSAQGQPSMGMEHQNTGVQNYQAMGYAQYNYPAPRPQQHPQWGGSVPGGQQHGTHTANAQFGMPARGVSSNQYNQQNYLLESQRTGQEPSPRGYPFKQQFPRGMPGMKGGHKKRQRN